MSKWDSEEDSTQEIASVSPVFDDGGAIAGFLAIQRDITSRRQTEEALHRSEALFRRIFDQLPVGAALVSTDGRVQRANSAYCGMMGRGPIPAVLRGLLAQSPVGP
jgi:PAS domain-containing protein